MDVGAHFLLTTFGSFGDLHPYIAVGMGLKSRGHTVTIATSQDYQEKVEGEGLQFRAVRPDLTNFTGNPESMAKAFHPRTGTEYIIRTLFLPYLEQTLEDTRDAARDADLLVGHPIAFATPTVAELLRKPWVSAMLQPAVLLSAYDPPKLGGMPWWFEPVRGCGPGVWRQLFKVGRVMSRRWGRPMNQLRRKLGLAESSDPIVSGMHSRFGNQGWFSNLLVKRQPDWPEPFEVTGFPFYDKRTADGGASALDPALESFLQAGEPPVVFTLGSSAVWTAGDFYRESIEGTLRIGRRAVLLTGPDPRNQPTGSLPPSVHVAEYAPYSQLLGRAAATIHQGGVGTTGQALLAGRPMLIVPYSHDQPDNAMRITRLGIGRTIARHKYRARAVARGLGALLEQPSYAENARNAAEFMRTEDGVSTACIGLERVLEKAARANRTSRVAAVPVT